MRSCRGLFAFLPLSALSSWRRLGVCAACFSDSDNQNPNKRNCIYK